MPKFQPGKKYKYKGYRYSSRGDTRYAEKDGHLKIGDSYTLIYVDENRDEAAIDVPRLGHWTVGLGCLEAKTLRNKNLPSWW